MATVYAAGCLAIEFGILPWTLPRLRDALLSCTRGHVALVAREQAGAARWQAAPLDSLRQYVRENCSGFVDLQRGGIEDISTHDHRACLGYINQHEHHGIEYLFSDRRFERIVGGAVAARRLKTDLAGRGWLATAAGAGRYSVQRTIRKGANLEPMAVPELVALRAAVDAMLWRKQEEAKAALWAVGRTHTFEDALVLAVNLGGDADTVGAVTGQLAGALYGATDIPTRWLGCERIEGFATTLVSAGRRPRMERPPRGLRLAV